MTNTPHDLALARAERDAWQRTCDSLHGTIAGLRVEVDAHLGRLEAADQRARGLEAALTHEREASKALTVQVEGWRAAWDRIVTIVDEAFGPFHVMSADGTIKAMERGIHDGIRAAQDLAAVRDLVAPGNPQGTVVDAVRARIQRCDDEQRASDRCAARADQERDAAIARADRAEAERDEARSEIAGFNATQERFAAERDRFRAEVTELRARPVLTAESLAVEIYQAREVRRYGKRADDAEAQALAGDEWFVADVRAALAALGPVTLPSPDRAEELLKLYCGEPDDDCVAAMARALAKLTPVVSPTAGRLGLTKIEAHLRDMGSHAKSPEAKEAWLYCAELINAEIRALAKLSPAPAPSTIPHAAGLLAYLRNRRERIADAAGSGAAAEWGALGTWIDELAKAPAREVAPTLVAVSDDELVKLHTVAWDKHSGSADSSDIAAIRAVRAKLGAAEVTEERLAAAIGTACDVTIDEAERRAKAVLASLRATAQKGG